MFKSTTKHKVHVWSQNFQWKQTYFLFPTVDCKLLDPSPNQSQEWEVKTEFSSVCMLKTFLFHFLSFFNEEDLLQSPSNSTVSETVS